MVNKDALKKHAEFWYGIPADTRKDSLEDMEDVPQEVQDEMIKRNTIMRLQFYPSTPIGFYTVYHYDYDSLISEALSVLREDLGLGG